MPALKPYWGKPAVRNLRKGAGDPDIIRSPFRAFALPDPPQAARRDQSPWGVLTLPINANDVYNWSGIVEAKAEDSIRASGKRLNIFAAVQEEL